MRKIRIGNDFTVLWKIERAGEVEDLTNITKSKLECCVVGEENSLKEIPHEIIGLNTVRTEITPQIADKIGRYYFILSYEFDAPSLKDGDRKCKVDTIAFYIVPLTAIADEITQVEVTSDVLIGLRGAKGETAYQYYKENTTDEPILTEQEFADKLAVIPSNENDRINAESTRVSNENERISNEVARKSNEVERKSNETTRISNEATREANEIERKLNEAGRVNAESDRVASEQTREQQEVERQNNTATAITNAETATQDAIGAKDDYYDVVKPAIQAQGVYAQAQGDYAKVQGEAIQDDLALKANHGYESNPKTLKQLDDEKGDHGYASIEVAKTLKEVEDDAVMRLINPITNGNFANGTTGWTFNSNISGASASNGVLSFTGGGSISSAISNWIRRTNITIFPEGHVLYNIVTARSLMGAIFYVGIGYSSSPAYNLTDQWVTYSYLGGRASINHPTYGAVLGQTVEMTNAMYFDLTEIFGEGNEPTKEEMDLLISTLGIDYFEGEITIPAQKVMQWQLKLIRKNKNAIIALGGTII